MRNLGFLDLTNIDNESLVGWAVRCNNTLHLWNIGRVNCSTLQK